MTFMKAMGSELHKAWVIGDSAVVEYRRGTVRAVGLSRTRGLAKYLSAEPSLLEPLKLDKEKPVPLFLVSVPDVATGLESDDFRFEEDPAFSLGKHQEGKFVAVLLFDHGGECLGIDFLQLIEGFDDYAASPDMFTKASHDRFLADNWSILQQALGVSSPVNRHAAVVASAVVEVSSEGQLSLLDSFFYEAEVCRPEGLQDHTSGGFQSPRP